MLSRATAVCALLIAVLAVASVPAGAAVRCDDVRGKVVKSTSDAKVVAQKRKKGRRFVGCAKPNGVVYALGRSRKSKLPTADEPQVSFRIRKLVGTYVLVREYFSEGCCGTDTISRYVFDLEDGRKRTIHSYSLAEGECGQTGEPAPPGYPMKLRLADNGIVVGVFVGDDEDPRCTQPGTQVIAFVPGNGPQVLDTGPNGSIPPASLALAGREVTWQHDGAGRSATL